MTTTKSNCWEHKQCQRQPGGALADELGVCPVAVDVTCDGINGGTNAGRFCWASAGTPCTEGTPRPGCQVTGRCRECSFFRRVMYEEGCHFQLLRPAMGTHDVDVLHGRINDIIMLVTMYRDIFACVAAGPLLQRITQSAIVILRCSSAGAYLLDTSGETLSLAASAGDPKLPGEVATDAASPTAAALAGRSTCRGAVTSSDAAAPMSAISSPIGGEHGPVGALTLARTEGEFSADDEWFIVELAMVAGLGIGSSRRIESLRDLRQVDEAKSNAVSLLLHHISSPLATIACSLTALQETGDRLDSDDRKKLFQYSLDRVDSIATLSKRLLDLAAIRSKGYLGQSQPVCVAKVLQDEVAARHIQALSAGLEMPLHITDEQGRVQADPDGLRMVLANLLDNAIKYSAGKGKDVTVSLDKDADHVRVTIRDEGIGMPAEGRDRLFEEFYRGGNAAASGAKGSGLGLAFVKELVNRYGGEVSLESQPGVGTAVTVEFPLAPQTAGESRQ